jgi:hypothetical protein
LANLVPPERLQCSLLKTNKLLLYLKRDFHMINDFRHFKETVPHKSHQADWLIQ